MKYLCICILTLLINATLFAQENTQKSTVIVENTPTPIISNVQVVNDPVYIKVEQSATFQGGTIDNFRKWVSVQIEYPKSAVKNDETGLCVVQFVVNTKGNVDRIKILKSSGFEVLDNEVIRVVESSPKWEPAMQGGTIVSQQFIIPIVFKQ